MSENQNQRLKTMRLGGLRSRVEFKVTVGESKVKAAFEGVVKDITAAGFVVVGNTTKKEYLVHSDDIRYLDPPTEVTADTWNAQDHKEVEAEDSGTEADVASSGEDCTTREKPKGKKDRKQR